MIKDSGKKVFVEYTPIVGFQHYAIDEDTREKMFVDYFIIEVPNNLKSISTDDLIRMRTFSEIAISKSVIPLSNPLMTLEGVLTFSETASFDAGDVTYNDLIDSLLKCGLIKRVVKCSAPMQKIKKPEEALSADDFDEINTN